MAIVGEAHIVVRAITVGFQRDVENSLRSVNGSVRQLGERTGKDFSNSLRKGMRSGGDPFGDIGKQATAARKQLNSLIKTGYLLGPAISGAVGGISALVSGLFSVAAAAGAATPALVVLPGILSAIAQAGIVARLAFAGVGKAISALTKQQTGGGGGGDNTKQIADARKALARAYQSAADRMADADDRVRKAQIALNQAYAKGAESLQQLGFDAEDAAIAQDKAAIELERARESLARVQDLPPNNRARRDAELAFKDAELNYRQAVDRANDLAKEQEYAAKTGIEGTQEVLDAKQELADAEQDQARTARDNAQMIADAQENVTEALNGTSGAASAAANAMNGLTESAKEFVRYIMEIKPLFDNIRNAAADGLFPGLIRSLQTLVERGFFERLEVIAFRTAKAIAGVAEEFANMISTTENMDRIDRIFGETNIVVIENLGTAAVNLGEALLIILDAARPLTEKFSEWVKLVSESWVETLKAKDATGELTDNFNKAGDAAVIIGGMLSSTGGAFFELGKGAKDAGLKIIQAFDGAMDKLKAFAEEGNKTGELQKKFGAIADNVISIGRFLGEVSKTLFDLGANPGIAAFFDKISAIPEILGGAAGTLMDSGASMGDFFVSLAESIALLTESGGVTAFFETLTTVLDTINNIFGNETIMDIFKVIAAIKGVTLAFGVVGSVAKFAGLNFLGAFKPVVGILNGTSFSVWGDGLADIAGKMENASGSSVGFKKGLGNLTAGFQLLGAQIWAASAPLLPWIALGALVAGALYMMWENSEIFRASVMHLVEAIGKALKDAMDTINRALKDVMPNVKGIGDLFKRIGDFAGTYVVPILEFLLVNAIRSVADIIGLVIRVGAGFLKAIFVDPIQGIKDVISAFVTFFGDRIRGIIDAAKNAFGRFEWFNGLIESAKSAFNGVARAWNNTIGKFSVTIPSWVPSVGGKKFDMPDIPYLAEGGVVRPTAGGTLARIAEAGRAERVEPLDSQGLSVRDRAIIAQLAGNADGRSKNPPVFNIYPSERMDEMALASIVSRKVAWNMRRGA